MFLHDICIELDALFCALELLTVDTDFMSGNNSINCYCLHLLMIQLCLVKDLNKHLIGVGVECMHDGARILA
jgi:hypothetical protein